MRGLSEFSNKKNKRDISLMDLIYEKEVSDELIVEETKKRVLKEYKREFDGDINLNLLEDFSIVQEKILNLLNNCLSLAEKNDFNTVIYNKIKEKLESNHFNAVVIGEFSRGKSTFINALIGKKVLPSNILPTTAVLTKVKYADDEKVELIFKDGSIEVKDVSCLINSTTNLSEESTKKSCDLTEANVYYPIELCKNNFSIIDTPGVNDINEQNCEITYNYLPNADAAIILLDPDQPFSASDRHFIQDKVLKKDINKIFFVLNKRDLIRDDKVEEIKAFIKRRIKETLNICNPKVYILSSKNTLLSRIKKLNDKHEEEFNKLEKDISMFLTREKGRLLINNVCTNLMGAINTDISNLDMYIKSLEKPLSDIEERHKKFIKVKVDIKGKKEKSFCSLKDIAEKHKVNIHAKIESDIIAIYNEINFDDGIKNIAENVEILIKAWIEDKLQGEFNKFRFEAMNVINTLTKDLEHSLEVVKITNSLTEIPLSLEVNNNYNELEKDSANIKGMIAGAGVGTLGVLFLPISLPITILASIAGGSFVKKFYENRAINKTTQIKEEISSKRFLIIDEIKMETDVRIDEYIKNIIDMVDRVYTEKLDNIENLLSNLIKDKSMKLKEISEKKNEANNTSVALCNIKSNIEDILLISVGEK